MQSFENFGLQKDILRAIEDLGFKNPSPIQLQTLPILLGEPTDLIGLAATGTGKTAAFSIPLLQKIDPSKKEVQALILCPTRELALQVSGQIDLLGKYLKIKSVPIYGGAGYSEQISGLRQGAKIVVGTPGRVIDHMQKGTLNLTGISTLILDEADEMISMGFKEDLEIILKAVPKNQSKIWLFSATMSREVRRVADTYLKKPAQIQVNQTEMLSSTVEQIFYATRESDKPEVLCKLIESADDFYGLIFCQTKSLVEDLTLYLIQRGYKVDSLHGDKDQKSRERTMEAFRTRKMNILVCTDVASRGLDVKDVTHVINFSIPRELDHYVHRIGRTARSGKSGIAMSLVSPAHRHLVSRIEKLTKSRIKEGSIPTRKEIGIKRLSKFLPTFQEQKFFTRAQEILGDDWQSAIANMEPSEIVGRFICMLAPDVFQDREIKPKVITGGESSQEPRHRERGRADNRSSHRGSHRGSRKFQGAGGRSSHRR